MAYKRRPVEKATTLALRDLGGSASRKTIRKAMADNEYDGLTYDDVYSTRQGKSGTYSPFMFDFNFGIKNLASVGYIQPPQRGQDIVLTSLGQNDDLTNYPRPEQQNAITKYWAKKNAERTKRNQAKKRTVETNPH